MKEIFINQIRGLYNQMYSVEEHISDCSSSPIKEGMFNINALFWSRILSLEHMEEMIKSLNRLEYLKSTKLQAVKNHPKAFWEQFLRARESLLTPCQDERFFSYLETLQLACHMHTHLYSMPFELDIFDGFRHDQYSARQLSERALLPFCNPYHEFIVDQVMPHIRWENPDILWFTGQPSISSFCIAKMLRETHPHIFIAISHHTGEFFSFAKIVPLLLQNHHLFSVFDCILLGDNSQTASKIYSCIQRGNWADLKHVENILYTPDRGKSIHCTARNSTPTVPSQPPIQRIAAGRPPNIRLFHNNHCYWNQCTFCAINKKHIYTTSSWDIVGAVEQLKRLSSLGAMSFWALDEAIPASILGSLCVELQNESLHFDWHVRARIDLALLYENLPERLAAVGLKHILLGFESGSIRVLRLMNKADELDTYLETAEMIVRRFNNLGIAVHFPSIIGFPSESAEERQETYRFLRYLKDKYPLFGYNINILNLDIASELYQRWEEFGITKLSYPCPPCEFLGNQIIWESVDIAQTGDLEEEQSIEMKQQFPWYPKDSLLNVVPFYAMWEYSRNQLDMSILPPLEQEPSALDLSSTYRLRKEVSFFRDQEGLWSLYNFDNHQCIRGGDIIHNLVSAFNTEITINACIEQYEMALEKPIRRLLSDLHHYGFIESTTVTSNQ